jgi:hypothetical protein
MSLDKAFEQLKLAALEVKALLIDIDENIQPTVHEVEQINAKIHHLSEQIAVYKYLKNGKELSPSLGIHLKVMEQAAIKTEVKEEIQSPERNDTANSESGSVRKLELSLNDKFRIINELFKQSSTEFNLALEQINTFNSYEKSKAYLDELKKLYSWKDDHEMTVKIYQLNQKRFQ